MTPQSRTIRSQSEEKNREKFDIRAFDFLNCESTCDLTDVQASINDMKTGLDEVLNKIMRYKSFIIKLHDKILSFP